MKKRILPIIFSICIAAIGFIFIEQVLAEFQLTNNPLTIDEGGTETIANTVLSVTDTLSPTAVFTYSIIDAPDNGTLYGDGVALGASDIFTQELIDLSLLTYEHSGGEANSDSFEFNVTNGLTIVLTNTFNINVDPINDGSSVAIDGTPTEDQTLTANVTDNDGTDTSIFTYQWYSSTTGTGSWVSISGANNQAYDLGDIDVGYYFQVNVIYEDDQGFAENTTSPAVGAVANVNDPGSVSIDGIVTEDETLTANVTDNDGVSGPITYQWYSGSSGTGPWSSIDGETNQTFEPGDDEVGDFIRVVATYTDDYLEDESPEDVTSSAVANVNDPGSVSISGTVQEDAILTANVTDNDGVSGSITYQWYSGSSGTGPWSEISGATNQTFAPGDDEVDDFIRVVATYTDDYLEDESPEDVTSSAVTNINDPGSVSISGTVQEDALLTANVTDHDGVSGSITYQWYSGGSGTGPWSEISGATNQTFAPGDDEVDDFIRVVATYTDDYLEDEAPEDVTSSAVANVNDPGSVSISGIVTEDETLTANVTDIEGVASSISYQWYRRSGTSGSWSTIGGATFQNYTLGDDDVNHYIRVVATYTDGYSFPESPEAVTASRVVNVNDPPNPANDAISVSEGQIYPLPFNVLDNDDDIDSNNNNLTTSITTPPSQAQTYNLTNDGQLTYQHDGTDGPSTDTIEYEVCDDAPVPLCATAFITITITYADDPPMAVPDTYYLNEGESITANVNINDTDEEGHPFDTTVPALSPPFHGNLDLESDGDFTYTHDGSENFADSFTYEICEPSAPPQDGSCTDTTVTLVITPTNDAPTTLPDVFYVPRSTTIDTALEIGATSVISNDSDIEGNNLIVDETPVDPPDNAELFILRADGSFIYTHNDSSNIPDSFTYRVCDDGSPSKCSTETVTISIGQRPTTFIYLPVVFNNYSVDEPNNDACEAHTIQLNKEYNYMPNDQEDWYRINLSSPANLTFAVNGYALEGDLIVYRSNDCTINGDDELKNDGTSKTSKVVNWNNAPAGIYYVRIFTTNPSESAPPYSLTVTTN